MNQSVCYLLCILSFVCSTHIQYYATVALFALPPTQFNTIMSIKSYGEEGELAQPGRYPRKPGPYLLSLELLAKTSSKSREGYVRMGLDYRETREADIQ